MAREVISSERAPAAIGPYSQAIRAGELVFCSGQIPLVPGTSALVPGDVRDQTRQVLSNLEAVLAAAGARLADVVRTTIYLTDLGNFQAVNEVYGEFFGAEPPARATVGVAALPRGAAVEIDAIAYLEKRP
ncbi:MAG: RidA family protein [Myxococcales bacterium]|nr:RidA family protein [Myxococcales bacterium]